MIRSMDAAEGVEEGGISFLTDNHEFMLHNEEIEDDGSDILSEDDEDDSSSSKRVGLLREQDRFLPIANVAKIMKRAVPELGKIAKEARECVQECVSEFISFITSEASDRCHMEKRKTINGEDILFAMSNLGFDNYVEPLKQYLQKYRETTKGEKVLEDAFGADALVAGQTSENVLYTTYTGQLKGFDSS